MALKLYGFSASTCTRRVLAVAYSLNLDIEFIPIDFATGQHKSVDFLKKQPFGQVPVLEDQDGTVMYESRAIARYLASKYHKNNPHLYPESGTRAFGLTEQWMSVEQSNFDPVVSGIVCELVIKPRFYKVQPDTARVDTLLSKLDPILDVYEAHLSQHSFLAGDHVTLADIFHLPFGVHFTTATPHSSYFHTRPHLKAWFDSLVALPAWNKVIKTLE